MVLKFLDKPQLGRNPSGAGDDWRSRFPEGSQPIATAPEQTSTPIVVYSADGTAQWALPHRGGWAKLQAYKDFKTGAVSWRMNGEHVNQPVAWSSPRRGK
jgi:hypothetical protein